MWRSPGTIKASGIRHFIHSNDTWNGNSGGALRTTDHHALGIVARHVLRCETCKDGINGATRMTQEVANTMVYWRNKSLTIGGRRVHAARSARGLTRPLAALWLALVVASSCNLLPAAPRPTPSAPGTVEGAVTDAEGRAIEGASITPVTGGVRLPLIDYRTREDGRYETRSLPAATYVITAAAMGYKPASQEVRVDPGRTSRVDFVLEPDPSLPSPPASASASP